MDTSKKIEWTVTKKDWQEEAVQDHLTCCLCGSHLKFQHRIDYVEQLATEEASCSSCNVRHRTTVHQLQ